MVRTFLRVSLLAAVTLAAWGIVGQCASAQAIGFGRSAPGYGYGYHYPPFQQFYAQPGVPAGMYPSPRPTPPYVGHTYVTYEPLNPHEFLYPHARAYYRYNPGAGWTTTRVLWW